MTAVWLRPMRADELAAYRASFVADWAGDLARVDDLPLAEATQLAGRRMDASLPDGVATTGHFLFVIVADDQPVGHLWFSVEPGDRAFLDDITVGEHARGRGIGRRALELFEAEAAARGLTRIDLHVYAHNPRALALYQRLGYQTTGIKMRKRLGAR